MNKSRAILILILATSLNACGQRYILKNGTAQKISELSYMNIADPLDSLFRVQCNSFEFNPIDNTITNETGKLCQRVGRWFYYDHNQGAYAEGMYRRGNEQGPWNYYSSQDQDSLIKEIIYGSGHALKTRYKSTVQYEENLLFRFLARHQILMVVLFFFLVIIHLVTNTYLLTKKGVEFSSYPISGKKLTANLLILYKFSWRYKTLQQLGYGKRSFYFKNSIGICLLLLFSIALLGSIFYPELMP